MLFVMYEALWMMGKLASKLAGLHFMTSTIALQVNFSDLSLLQTAAASSTAHF